jgi:polyhydroxyalkanoate synthase
VTVEKTDDLTAERAAEAVAGAEDAGSLNLPELLTAGLRAVTRGGNVARATAGLSAEAARILAGRSEAAAAKGDWRFADPTWDDNPAYRRLMQLYLALCGTINGVVDEADLDWRSRERARFAAGTPGVSPSSPSPGATPARSTAPGTSTPTPRPCWPPST